MSIFRRQNIHPEIRKCVAKRVKSLSPGTSLDHIIKYFQVRLNEDETPDSIDHSLEANVVDNI